MLSAFRQAWVSWRTAPGVALLAVVAFAVGIGSATAIFTVVNGVLLRPLPYPGGERFVSLYRVNTTDPGTPMRMSVPELQDYEQQTTSFDAFGWFRTGRYQLTAPGEPQFVPGAAVTPALARQLGPPMLGQWFADDTSAVISSSLWRRLGGGREIVGSVITLDQRQYTISGVMPRTFQFPLASLGISRGETEVWIPLNPSPPDASRGSSNNIAYARRKPGVSLEQAEAEAKRIAAAITTIDPVRYQNYTAGVADLREATIGMIGASVRAPLLILLSGAGLLLLIACANVATLMLARSVARARETAIRVALGASRRQLALRYFAEGALVSGAGAAAGVGLSVILVRHILAAASGYIPRTDDITIDWTVLGFSVAAAVATGVLASLAPFWQAIRLAPNAVLSEGVRASAAAPARRLSKALVVAEIALSFTLLATSAILVVHLHNLGRVSLGFDPDGLVVFDLTLPPRAAAAEQARLMDALRLTPGVAGAAFANQLSAFCGGGGTTIHAEGRPKDALGQRVCIVRASPDFFSTMRIPIRAGRVLNESDTQREPLTVVINETAARAAWP
ncbi:MAG TPA: ABC transporter permease, partial [Vicinamibacterales bacterium]|nr:ABC transporter permease [Vicinamibacterales bacterium]